MSKTTKHTKTFVAPGMGGLQRAIKDFDRKMKMRNDIRFEIYDVEFEYDERSQGMIGFVHYAVQPIVPTDIPQASTSPAEPAAPPEPIGPYQNFTGDSVPTVIKAMDDFIAENGYTETGRNFKFDADAKLFRGTVTYEEK